MKSRHMQYSIKPKESPKQVKQLKIFEHDNKPKIG